MAGPLRVDRLAVDRGGRRVLSEVSLTLAPGDIVVVVGPNGAGKSTLLEATLGLLPVAAGRVSFNGRPLHDLPARSRVFSYMPDDAEPPPEVRVRTLVAYAGRFGGAPRQLIDWLVARLGLTEIIRERAGRLSRGQKRRVLLFTALCSSRPVVVLDEPTAAFDPLQLLDVLAVLRDRAAAGVSLLLSAHQMSDAEKIASRILVLDAGMVVAHGTLAELRERSGRADGSLEDVVLELLRARERHACA
jgi:ABC-type multidrug transport system ATPase subunit